MQKKNYCSIKIILTSLLFVLLGLINSFYVQTNKVDTETKNLLFSNSTESVVKSINGFTATYSEKITDKTLDSLSFEEEYNGGYQLFIDVQATDLTDFGYKWFYSEDNSTFIELENENKNNILLKNCNQSGYYYCQVYEINNETNFENADVVNFVISPKTVYLSEIEAISKEFDGRIDVLLNGSLSGAIEGDNISVAGNGHVSNANAEKDKYVYVDEISLTGLDKDNYILDKTYNKPIFVEITKKATGLTWKTTDDKVTFDYTGKDLGLNVSAYYYNIKGQKIELPFTIKGNAIGMPYNYLNEFINAGAYTFTIVLSEAEKNYLLTDDSGDMSFELFINKIKPIITIEDAEFTYNGTVQDARKFVAIDNKEQTLIFENNLFTTVKQANENKVKVYVLESQNYFAFSKEFSVTMLKAESKIDVSNVVKEYVYNGEIQYVNSGALVNNTEQQLRYLENSFKTVEQGDGLSVIVYAPASDNYNEAFETFRIKVYKADISTVGWSWNYSSDYTYNGNLQSVNVINYDKDLVYPYYVDEAFVNAGTYTAKVSFYLNDDKNYNPVVFDDIVWTIKKATIEKPSKFSYTTIYNGQTQSFPTVSNNYYTVTNSEYKNAGTYNVVISLKDTLNTQWKGGDSSSYIINWTIEKITISQPTEKIRLEYNGQTQSLNLQGSSNYTIINGTAKEVGNYTSYLVLNDTTNYKWVGTDSAYVSVNWEICSNKTYNAVPIVVIVAVSIVVILIGVYITLHFTVINKKKGKKREVKK